MQSCSYSWDLLKNEESTPLISHLLFLLSYGLARRCYRIVQRDVYLNN